MARLRPYFQKSRGKPQIDGLRVPSGIIFISRNGLSWRVTQAEHGPPKTLYNRWKRLSRSFLHRFLAFQAQALQRRGLPKEFVDKL
jgi:transposase